MKEFFGKRREKLFNLRELDFEKLALYIFPRFLLEIIRKYFRLEIEGMENIPARGRAIILPNHSGWAGFDAVMIGNEIHKAKNRIPRILAHPAFFMGDIKMIAEKVGFQKANTDNGIRLLKKNNLVILFPEGEHGNFKPTSKRYQLQEFKRGFVRMALASGAPIIPTLVIGAEETNINLATLKLTKYLKGQIIPIPLNLVPLPAKWKIKFLPPIEFKGYTEADATDNEVVHKLANEVHDLMQAAIDKEVQGRKWIYFPPPPQE